MINLYMDNHANSKRLIKQTKIITENRITRFTSLFQIFIQLNILTRVVIFNQFAYAFILLLISFYCIHTLFLVIDLILTNFKS